MRDPEPLELRRVAGTFATGVSVVTAARAGQLHGLTVNSFTTVSLEPPLVLICVGRTARSHDPIAAGPFAVNVLADDQEELARRFAVRDDQKFDGLAYREGTLGAPILEGVVAWLECVVVERHRGGDTHTIVIARVDGMGTADRAPLVYHRGRYTRIAG